VNEVGEKILVNSSTEEKRNMRFGRVTFEAERSALGVCSARRRTRFIIILSHFFKYRVKLLHALTREQTQNVISL